MGLLKIFFKNELANIKKEIKQEVIKELQSSKQPFEAEKKTTRFVKRTVSTPETPAIKLSQGADSSGTDELESIEKENSNQAPLQENGPKPAQDLVSNSADSKEENSDISAELSTDNSKSEAETAQENTV